MVCFTQRKYQFTHAQRPHFANLLKKYYSDIGCTVAIDGYANDIHLKCDNLDKLPISDSYILTTENYWDEYATIRAMPSLADGFVPAEQEGMNHSLVLAGAEIINSAISLRIKMDNIENPIYKIFSNIMDNSSSQESSSNTKVNFQEIKSMMSYVDLSQVTHYYCSNASELILLVIQKQHGIAITTTNVSGIDLPILDLAKGFLQNKFKSNYILSEWSDSFESWHTKCEKTNWASWNDVIIRP